MNARTIRRAIERKQAKQARKEARLAAVAAAEIAVAEPAAAAIENETIEQPASPAPLSRPEINRLNARFSTGPTSAAGKAASSMNALKTGLTGRTVLLPTDDVAAYEATIARFIDRWQPATDEERVLVQSLADNEWRTQRIPALEYGIYAEGACQFADDFAGEPDPAIRRTRIQTKTFLTYARQLMNLQTQDARLRRQREKDEARLEKIQGDRKYQAAKAAQQQKQEAQPQRGAVRPSSGGFEFSNSKRSSLAGLSPRETIAFLRAEDEAEEKKAAEKGAQHREARHSNAA